MSNISNSVMVSLLIRGDDIDHQTVGRLLEVTAESTWSKGDRRYNKDRTKFYEIKTGGWRYDCPPHDQDESELSNALALFTQTFGQKADVIRALGVKYPDSIIDIYIDTSKSSSIPVNFTARELALLASFGLDLETTIYAGEPIEPKA